VINNREVQVMRRVISGEPIGYIAEYFGVTKNAILGIFGRGCRKARHLEDIKKRLDEAEAMKAEINELKQTVAVLNRDLKSQREVEEEQRKMEEAELREHIARTDSLLKLLNTNIVDWDLPVRALNCLKAIDVETIGDLVRLNKVDLLKARNFGKRSLGEVEDLIIGLGLGFGMDVDKIYRERIAMKMKEYGKADGESE
jgi:DNA-directed RNA polymerase alpha subunit